VWLRRRVPPGGVSRPRHPVGAHRIVARRDDVDVGCVVVSYTHVSGVEQELRGRDVEVGRTHNSKFLRRNR
jgi:hypothetical protein